MKRRVAVISLFFCLVAPVVATFVFLHYQKSLVRKEVKHNLTAGIDKEELVLLKFTEEESQTKLRWEHSAEFEYEGEMYDIVKKEAKGDTTYYWCWWDHEETRLNKQLDELATNAFDNSPEKKESRKKLTEFFKKLYCNSYACFPLVSDQVSVASHHYIECYNAVYQAPPAPPPRFS